MSDQSGPGPVDGDMATKADAAGGLCFEVHAMQCHLSMCLACSYATWAHRQCAHSLHLSQDNQWTVSTRGKEAGSSWEWHIKHSMCYSSIAAAFSLDSVLMTVRCLSLWRYGAMVEGGDSGWPCEVFCFLCDFLSGGEGGAGAACRSWSKSSSSRSTEKYRKH